MVWHQGYTESKLDSVQLQWMENKFTQCVWKTCNHNCFRSFCTINSISLTSLHQDILSTPRASKEILLLQDKWTVCCQKKFNWRKIMNNQLPPNYASSLHKRNNDSKNLDPAFWTLNSKVLRLCIVSVSHKFHVPQEFCKWICATTKVQNWRLHRCCNSLQYPLHTNFMQKATRFNRTKEEYLDVAVAWTNINLVLLLWPKQELQSTPAR